MVSPIRIILMQVYHHDLELTEIRGGHVRKDEKDTLLLTIPPTQLGYTNAQVDDYRKLPRHQFPWRPPVLLKLRARASHPHPIGTLGFGFWNDPFTLSIGQGGAARRVPAGPQAVWFFYGSPPNDIALVPGIPGYGWKAASLKSPTIPTILLAPLAIGAITLAQIPWLRRSVMKSAQRVIKAAECLLDLRLDEWHHYTLNWMPDRVIFEVDGEPILTAQTPPTKPLGFVAWIDNQYAVASPVGGFRFGVLPTDEEQWLELTGVSLETQSESV
jgi:hypothetical protein